MSRSVTITVPMMPPREVSPNWRGTWRAKAAAKRAYRECAGWAVREQVNGPDHEYLQAGRIVLDAEIAWCCGRKRMDDDNAKASLKAAIDGIADVLWAGDDARVTLGTVEQSRGEGATVLTLRDTETGQP